MKKIEFERDGYEIVVEIFNGDYNEMILEAHAYYKDFELYKIFLLANTEQSLIDLATSELLLRHPFEKVILNYDSL